MTAEAAEVVLHEAPETFMKVNFGCGVRMVREEGDFFELSYAGSR